MQMLQDVHLYGVVHAPSTPYTVNHEGKGPAWANSLFEDNAEFGYGMYLGVKQMRNKIEDDMQELLSMIEAVVILKMYLKTGLII